MHWYTRETMTFDDKDLPWINNKVKHLINEKNYCVQKLFKKKKSGQSFAMFLSFQNQLSS